MRLHSLESFLQEILAVFLILNVDFEGPASYFLQMSGVLHYLFSTEIFIATKIFS